MTAPILALSALSIRPEHEATARTLALVLTLGDAEGWEGFAKVAAVRLTEPERVALAFWSAVALAPDHREAVAEAVVAPAGAPLPPFLDPAADAVLWAAAASRAELVAYAVAALSKLPSATRHAIAEALA